MQKFSFPPLLLTALLVLLPLYPVEGKENRGTRPDSRIRQLDEKAVFTFAIMSDHKGLSPVDSERFARMAQWIEQSGDQFVIGLGDHLKINRPNTFLPFLQENRWWHDHFYPNIADGENEYYGGDQNAWGKGGPLLTYIGLEKRPNVSIQPNGCDYYVKIPIRGYTIHLIQLHYPDHPRDPRLAFKAESRQFLEDTLKSIDKGPKDIVIAAAHSITGFWMESLSKEHKELLAQKCDLVLSATTHHFQRLKLAEYGDSGGLVLNTGSVTYPDSGIRNSLPGYIEVHVLEKPLRLDVKYLNVNKEYRSMPGREYDFTKLVGGKTRYTEDIGEGEY